MSIAGITVPDIKMAAAFKMLKDMPMVQAANATGIDKYFDKKTDIVNFMYRVFLKVKKDPERYGVLPETVMEVDKAMASRSVVAKVPDSPFAVEDAFEKLSNIKEADIKGIVLTGRNKAAMLMDRKMNQLLRSKKALEKENIVSLAKVFGIYFDKGRIIQGEATENIAVLSKIQDNLSPEEAMDALIKSREKVMEEKEY